MLTLRAAVDTDIRRHGRESYPDECCGALVGLDGLVTAALALPNAAGETARRRFTIAPHDYLAAERSAAEQGAELLGFYHSHPDHPARPSRYDLDHAWPEFRIRDRGGRGRTAGRAHLVALARGSLGVRRGAGHGRGNAMPTRVLIPTPLRVYAGKQDVIEVEGSTVGELLANMTAEYTELRKHLYNEDGRLRAFVAIFLNDDDIRFLQKEATPVKEGDTVSIIPTVAGGGGL